MMIRIKRPIGSMPLVLRKKQKGYDELLDNNKLFALGKTQEMTFKVYRDQTVRDALESLFGRKCVFCESLLLATQPGHIEHYRPKGRVVFRDPVTNTNTKKQGYYWLGARWHNLLLACNDCNSPRTQKDAAGRSKVFGKASFFPLADEAMRATEPKGVRKEKPLLLHPCADEPEQHLSFTDDGGIRPHSGAHGLSPKGAATIEYCGLDRAELLQMRARHRRTVMASIRHIIEAVEKEQDPGQDLQDLLCMLDPKEAYTAFTKHLVRKFLAPYLHVLGLPL